MQGTVWPATYVVTSINDDGSGSLREAIDLSNAEPDLDRIEFNIPGPGVRTLQLLSELPTIYDPVVLDAYTQPGASSNTLAVGNNATNLIELDGEGIEGDASGLVIIAGGSAIRGLVINRFAGHGIWLDFLGTNHVAGNFIGTDATGRLDRGNDSSGIRIEQADGNKIGGVAPADRNVIAANHGAGIDFIFSSGNVIQGNYIGLDALGQTALGNDEGLLLLGSSPANQIGGDIPGAGNVISGHAFLPGLTIHSVSNVIQGNLIGLDAYAFAVVGNGSDGIQLMGSDNRVGGFDPVAPNIISGNRNHGVSVLPGASGNAILGNRIFGNLGLGIDLGRDGVTPNDAGDNDLGANKLQNSPEVVEVRRGAGLEIHGTLAAGPGLDFRIECFASDVPDTSGFGEGQWYLGSTNVTTDVGGTAAFTLVAPTDLPCGVFITATATDPLGNTSEFSKAMRVSTEQPIIYVNDQVAHGLSATVTSAATVRFEVPFAGSVSRYALDGFEFPYTGPFVVTQTVVLRVLAENASLGCSVESDPFTNFVLHPPAVQISPELVVLTAGDAADFYAVASGTPAPTFQWFHHGDPLPNQTRSTLHLEPLQAADSGNYTVRVTNVVGWAESSTALLTVGEAPGIGVQPSDVTAMPGAEVTLCVTALGTEPLRYQWRLNGVNLPGETNDCHHIASVTVGDGGSYTVTVANRFGAVTSEPALLTVTVTERPAGDDFEDAVVLFGASGVVKGNNETATQQQGELKHAGKPGKHSVWYVWTAPAAGIARFSTAGSAFDTLLAVYTGSALNNLVSVVEDEDGGKFYTSEVAFNASAGAAYQIAIDGFANRSGDYVLSWDLETTAAKVPIILAHPQSQTVARHESVQFEVTASGAPNLQYQWLFNGLAIPGAASATYTRTDVQPEDLGYYSVRVSSGGLNPVTSQPASLEIGPFASVQSRNKLEDLFPNDAFGTGGQGGNGGGGASPGIIILVSVGSIGQQIWNNTFDSFTQSGESNHCGVIGGSSRWLAFRHATNGVIALQSTNSTYATVLSVYTNAISGVSTSALVLAACDDNRDSHDTNSVLRFPVRAGIHYYIVLDGVDGASGISYLHWQFGIPPVETGQPSTTIVQAGANVILNAAHVVGIPGPSYRWTLNNRLLPVQPGTNAFVLENLRPEQAGTYRLILENFAGTTTNQVAVVSVLTGELKFGLVYDPDKSNPFKIVTTLSQFFILEKALELPGAPGFTTGPSFQWVPVRTNLAPNELFEYVDPEFLNNPRGYYRGRQYFP